MSQEGSILKSILLFPLFVGFSWHKKQTRSHHHKSNIAYTNIVPDDFFMLFQYMQIKFH